MQRNTEKYQEILTSLHLLFFVLSLVISLIQTYAANVLIAINPFEYFPEQYGFEQMKTYREKPLTEVPPHVYAFGMFFSNVFKHIKHVTKDH